MGQPRMDRGENPSSRGLDLCRVDFLSREPLKNMGVPRAKPRNFDTDHSSFVLFYSSRRMFETFSSCRRSPMPKWPSKFNTC